MRKLNKSFGAILIIAGTAIGGGMIAMPIASSMIGFEYSLYIMLSVWGLMLFTALEALEINMYFKKGVSISHAAEVFLGKGGKLLASLTIGFLFYALLAAYMTGGCAILRQCLSSVFEIETQQIFIVPLFTLFFGGIIVARTKAVDITNRIFIFMMIACFILLIYALLPEVKMPLLTHSPHLVPSHLCLLVPLFFTSFGFHGSIPTLINYVGPNPKKLRFIFLLGSLIPVCIYMIWEALTLGVLPLEGFLRAQSSSSSIGTFIEQISHVVGWTSFPWIIQGFIFLAIVTSFLGVGIGLFDFIEEHTRFVNQALVSLLTFGLPLLFALFYPNGFIAALSYAAVALSLLAVIIPTLIVLKMRHQKAENNYKAPGGEITLIFILLAGILVIALDIIHMLG